MGVGRGATRVAIYARVSTGEQTPELQLRELCDYAGRRKRRQPLRAIWGHCKKVSFMYARKKCP